MLTSKLHVLLNVNICLRRTQEQEQRQKIDRYSTAVSCVKDAHTHASTNSYILIIYSLVFDSSVHISFNKSNVMQH